MERKPEELSLDDKQEAMFDAWLSPQGVEFVSAEAEKLYKERVTRIKDAVQLRKPPDRVPVFPIIGFFPAYYTGITPEEAMYDYDKLSAAWEKYVLDFEPDAHLGIGIPTPGKVHEILDYKLYAWPGHGSAPNLSYQCLEQEYVKEDEYDALIQDPSYFFNSTYLPRIFGALAPLKMLSNLTGILEIVFVAPLLIPFGLPDVQAAYKALFEAGAEALKWVGFVAAHDKKMAAAGFPNFFGGFSKAPFDVIGDTLRGTRGVMLDMYRQPDKLLQAMEVVTPLMIKLGASAAKMAGNPIVFIPLHKGADSFLSDEQYKTFYWPTLRKVLIGLINEGCVPFPWAEGSYNTRLEVIRDVPKGKVIWGFDRTDMAKAKEILGDVACIGGNIPVTLLSVGAPQQVRDYVKQLIDTVGKGGGYIVMNGVALDDVKPENVRAMVDSTKEFGFYG